MFEFFSKGHKALLKELEKLRKQVNEKPAVSSQDIERIVSQQVERIVEEKLTTFFRYQNSLAVALATHAESDSKIFTIAHRGIKAKLYLPNGASDSLQRDVIRTSAFYQPKPLRFIETSGLLPANPSVVDVGANFGNHTVFFGVIIKASSIHSFEPNPPVFETLKRNVEVNDLSGIVTLHQAGAGEVAMKARNAGHKISNSGGNSLVEDASGDVDILRLDDCGIVHVDFLKIDVEGHGAGVVKGGWDLISKSKPLILMEISNEGERDVLNRLSSELGYREIKSFDHDVLLSAK